MRSTIAPQGNVTAPVLAPCLPGCEDADRRDAELAESDWGHNCTVTIAVIETMYQAIPAEVQVIQWIASDGSTRNLRVEILHSDGRQLDDGFTPAGVAALAVALGKAAALMAGAR